MPGIYVRRGEGKVAGPIEAERLKAMAAAGKVLKTDQVASDPAGPWSVAGSASWLFPSAAPARVAVATPEPEPEPIEAMPEEAEAEEQPALSKKDLAKLAKEKAKAEKEQAKADKAKAKADEKAGQASEPKAPKAPRTPGYAGLRIMALVLILLGAVDLVVDLAAAVFFLLIEPIKGGAGQVATMSAAAALSGVALIALGQLMLLVINLAKDVREIKAQSAGSESPPA